MAKKIKIGLVILFVGIAVFGGWFILKNQLQISREGFGIYLLENDELVISDKDIISYNKTSHEIKLTEYGIKKIEALKVPLQGSPFVVKINDEKIYNGSFVTPISSIPPPPSEVVIVTLVSDNNTIQIEKGYPTPNVDPRNNSQLFDYFQKVGKLIQ